MEVAGIVDSEEQENRVLVVRLQIEIMQLLVDLRGRAPHAVLDGLEEVLLVEALEREELRGRPVAWEFLLVRQAELRHLFENVTLIRLFAPELHFSPARHLGLELFLEKLHLLD